MAAYARAYQRKKAFTSNDMLESVVFESNEDAQQKNDAILELTASGLAAFPGLYL